MGLDMTEEDILEAMAEIDTDNSGEIDKEEFKQWFASVAAGGSHRVNSAPPSAAPTATATATTTTTHRLAEIRARAILAGSSLAAVSRPFPSWNHRSILTEISL
jgi:hypothetical protein|eukprot:SAG25_NODE_2274_length_1761_cov_3.027076_2_plen_104_part_00